MTTHAILIFAYASSGSSSLLSRLVLLSFLRWLLLTAYLLFVQSIDSTTDLILPSSAFLVEAKWHPIRKQIWEYT